MMLRLLIRLSAWYVNSLLSVAMYVCVVIYLQCADETHHRDVNHTFASMKSDDPSPYVMQHRHNAELAWRLSQDGSTAANVITESTAVHTSSTGERAK